MRTWLSGLVIFLGLMVPLAPVGAQGATSGMDDGLVLQTSLAYLQARASQFGIRNASQEFQLRKVVRDSLGQTHVRLDQVYRGVPVWGNQLIVHLDENGAPQSVNGTYLPGINISTHAALSADEARTAATRHHPGPLAAIPEAGLVIYPRNGQAQLAYRVVLSDDETPRRIVVFVDAWTGQIVFSYNDLRSLLPSTKPVLRSAMASASAPDAPEPAMAATGTGNSLYSGTVTITTAHAFFRYRMVDPSRGGLSTSDMRNRLFGGGRIFADRDNVWGDGTTSDRASAGVDAHFGAEMTWDYYFAVHGRNGIFDDGVGSRSRVHYATNYNNAFWSDGCKCMTYGDGDGSFFSPLTSLDVAGHEMTHGVTSATADLIYSGESGGLNEAMSDIFGTMVEFYAAAHGATKTPNYLIGEDIFTPGTPGDALRYMSNPTQDGHSIDSYSDYFDGINVHYSSGIANIAFYLLAEGGTHPDGGVVTGIGRSAAEQIFYRALSVYMVPSETFSAARASTIQAATDLFGAGSQQVTSVGQAWDAVAVP